MHGQHNCWKAEAKQIGRSGRVFGLLFADEGLALSLDNAAVDRDIGDVVARGNVVHQIEHQLLEQRSQSPRACALFQRGLGERLQRVLREVEVHALHREEFAVLFEHRILRFGED